MRLYVENLLKSGEEFPLQPDQLHYVRNVLRHTTGQMLNVFNQQSGEWEAVLTALDKNKGMVRPLKQVGAPYQPEEVWLLFSPLKHDAQLFMIEKATELGVTHFLPVITERCTVSRIKSDKLARNAVEAVQQCERLDLPDFFEPQSLADLLADWDKSRPLIVCRERGESAALVDVLDQVKLKKPLGFLIGPEGGFSAREINLLEKQTFVTFASLGPRILRAETAAIAVLSCYQAIIGDWQALPNELSK